MEFSMLSSLREQLPFAGDVPLFFIRACASAQEHPSPFSHQVHNWLNKQFPDIWIHLRDLIIWLLHPPDQKPFIFFLWRGIKQNVYAIEEKYNDNWIDCILVAVTGNRGPFNITVKHVEGKSSGSSCEHTQWNVGYSTLHEHTFGATHKAFILTVCQWGGWLEFVLSMM
jgi:hypothetical protein